MVNLFRKMLTLCAQSCGSLLNVTRIANDLGVARSTIDSWLSILEASYVLFRLQPYHVNVRKRLIRTPKIYFYDTGLLCFLLGIQTIEQLRNSVARGAIFENAIISETLKQHLNAGRNPDLFFYRDDSKIEIDLIDVTNKNKPQMIEIKSVATFKETYLRHLKKIGDDLSFPIDQRCLIMRSHESHTINGYKIWSAQDWLLFR